MGGSYQITKNKIILSLIKIIQFNLKIYPHLWVGGWVVGWMGGFMGRVMSNH